MDILLLYVLFAVILSIALFKTIPLVETKVYITGNCLRLDVP